MANNNFVVPTLPYTTFDNLYSPASGRQIKQKNA